MSRIMRARFNTYWAIFKASHSMLVLLSNVMHTCWTTFSKKNWFYHLPMNFGCFSSNVCLPTWRIYETRCELGFFWWSWHFVGVSSLCVFVPKVVWIPSVQSRLVNGFQSKVYELRPLICVWFKLKTLRFRHKTHILYVGVFEAWTNTFSKF